MVLPDAVALLGRDEIVSGGESNPTRDPGLHTDLDPPPLSPSSNTTSVLFREGLTRLDSFLDLAHSRLEHAAELEEREPLVIRTLPVKADIYNVQNQEYLKFPENITRWKEVEEIKSDASNTSNNSTFYSESEPEEHPSYETFFDPSPSSAGPSPTSPFHPDPDLETDSVAQLVSNMVPELSVPIQNKLSPTPSPSAEADAAMTNTQWRPMSAPKTSQSRAASPLLFWNRKGTRQQQGARDMDADWFAAEKRESDDATYVDSVSNHLGKMTPPALGTPSGWADLKDSPGAEDNRLTATPPSITREEYEALPLAIQRKYFSAVERLQFEKSEVDRIYNHYDLSSHSPRHQRHRPALSSPDTLSALPNSRNLRQSYVTAESDSSWVLNYPEKVNKTELTREEQVHLVKHLRASVILDAANAAVSRAGRRRGHDRSLPPTPDIDRSTATLSSRRGSLDSMVSRMAQPDTNGRDDMRESLYDSFRWLDEEEDLDLGLFMDDYHANLREEVPQTGKNRRPSFRRRLSISKLPFGRSSMSSNRPSADTKDAPPVQIPIQTQQPTTTHKRLSRTLSMMNPAKHTLTDSTIQVVDPPATHYQDPAARQKLRSYLASPSKFDEAIQYGFPARDSQEPPTLNKKHPSRTGPADESENMRSFLDFEGDEDEDEDEDPVGNDDASSVSDPDSPKTPQMGGLTPPPGHQHPRRVSTDPPSQSGGSRQTPAVAPAPSKPTTSDSYVSNPTSSREMTLRMTLTRPDLRANEELIYGWQPRVAYIEPARRSQSNPVKADPPIPTGGTVTACWSDGQGQTNMDNIENILAGLDHWSADGAGGDRGVMKRIWNKVRRA